MKVKVIDEGHEKDLEYSVNEFLDALEGDLIDIKYQVAISTCGEEQIYCFSAMIIYESWFLCYNIHKVFIKKLT